MPALPDQPGVLRIDTFFGVSTDADVRTTLYFKYSGTPPSSTVCASIAGSIFTAATTELVPLMDDDHSLTGVTITDLTSPTSGQGSHAGSVAGTRGGAVLAAGTACLVNYRIARRYRGGKPRSYWPFGTSTDLANNSNWGGTFVSGVQASVTAYVADISSITDSGTALGAHVFASVQNPVTLRWRNIPTPRPTAIAPDVVTSLAVSSKPASQRRRNLQT
jgi:hypothetical protein